MLFIISVRLTDWYRSVAWRLGTIALNEDFLLAEDEASRALKTLRSSKAPLAKKRQVMRAMTGDYRQKMEEEKKKQYKLIQNGER